MMRLISYARYAGIAVVTAGVLSAAVACTSSPTSSNVASSATSSAASGVGASTSASASPCTGSELQVTVKSAGVAMNHSGRVLIFTNRSSSTCTLQGYPGTAVVKGSSTLLNAARSLVGYMADDPGLKSAPLVTLAPGKSASTMVEWLGNAEEPCYATGTGTLRVTPPDTHDTQSFGTLTLGGNGICAGFEVHPVTSGVLRYINY